MKFVRFLAVACITLLLFTHPVFSSELKIDLNLEKEVVYAGDEIAGTFKLKNTQDESVELNKVRITLVTPTEEIAQESQINLSVTVPPNYSDSLPISFAISEVRAGDYTLRIELNHSKGVSIAERQIVVKSKRVLANQEIENAEKIIGNFHDLNLSSEEKRYLLKSEKSLNKSKNYYSNGEFSLSYDYARIAIQYAEIAKGEKEYTEKVTLPKEPRQKIINYSEVEKVLNKIREVEKYTPTINPKPQQNPQSLAINAMLLLLIGVNTALVIFLINKFIIKKK